jgi:hypothetical protein
MLRKMATGATIAFVGLSSMAATASADPSRNVESITLTCDNGETYAAVVAGMGEFTTAHILDSTSVFIPVSFGSFSGTIRDDEGNIVDQFSEDEPIHKGQSLKGLKQPVGCTYSFVFVSDGSDPEVPEGWTFTGEGTVVGRLAPGAN